MPSALFYDHSRALAPALLASLSFPLNGCRTSCAPTAQLDHLHSPPHLLPIVWRALCHSLCLPHQRGHHGCPPQAVCALDGQRTRPRPPGGRDISQGLMQGPRCASTRRVPRKRSGVGGVSWTARVFRASVDVAQGQGRRDGGGRGCCCSNGGSDTRTAAAKAAAAASSGPHCWGR
ncbi:hypothetical protein BU14_0126s0032 [Porphyra umbilicalis]|uniref:Uncharacterized protein n=1 Tax=Porphyra umbilicalis TaxID=2786 RepID=A0A1X6PBF8_PORUM|nr:hypothetical protein BU14_0126s0032 [Porphyra umbilicalis]|eukprot:OSX77993.1 hypothetical protein BU14_0126s0032 [Porphyra umbilicalis]